MNNLKKSLPFWVGSGLILTLVGSVFVTSSTFGTPAMGDASDGRIHTAPLSRKQELGKDLFFDTNLSNPAGQSCASCHAQETGFVFPDSHINETLGTAPGVIPGRFGNRAVPTAGYAAFLPAGPPTYSPDLTAFVGGLFWDGRATDLQNQATFPFQNPNEMNNLVHNMGSPALVVDKLGRGEFREEFKKVYGSDIFRKPTSVVFNDLTNAIADYERSSDFSPFSSKYDYYIAGKAQLTDEELDGLRLFTGSWTGRPGGPVYRKQAQCVLCHGINADASSGPDIFSNSCFANVGVPKNLNNPYYKMTDAKADPAGYNPAGKNYIDLGLGGTYYPTLGLPPGNLGAGSTAAGDYLAIDGTFKAPTVRNVDKRPSADFVKAYDHNGFFKDLKTVVHFYNTRNLTTVPGEVIDFTQPNPYAHLKGKPLWPLPEFPSAITLQNPSVALGSSSAQVGNLGLTDEEEDHIVAFLKTLSDGYEPEQNYNQGGNNNRDDNGRRNDDRYR